MHAFSQNHLDAVGTFTQNHDVHELAGFGYANFDFFVVHGVIRESPYH
jgi:hypothetical protein